MKPKEAVKQVLIQRKTKLLFQLGMGRDVCKADLTNFNSPCTLEDSSCSHTSGAIAELTLHAKRTIRNRLRMYSVSACESNHMNLDSCFFFAQSSEITHRKQRHAMSLKCLLGRIISVQKPKITTTNESERAIVNLVHTEKNCCDRSFSSNCACLSLRTSTHTACMLCHQKNPWKKMFVVDELPNECRVFGPSRTRSMFLALFFSPAKLSSPHHIFG